MLDQATDLRKLVLTSEATGKEDKTQKARVFSITSGKGGVGKTSIAINLAFALKQLNKNTLIIDADLGLANVDILLGLIPKWTLQNIVNQEVQILEAIIKSPDGLSILPSGSGIEELTHLDLQQKLYLKSQFDLLDRQFEFILIDTAAGISSNVMTFNQMAQEVIVVLSPDPTSLADAYATIKILSQRYAVEKFLIITNNVKNNRVGQELYKKLEKICWRFLKLPLQHLGCLWTDPKLSQASQNQQIVMKHYPKTTISKQLRGMAESLSRITYTSLTNKNINFLLNTILNTNR